MSTRAWLDAADADVSRPFPAWADEASAPPRKRFRDDALDSLLARTDSLLAASAAPPAVLSVLPLPRDAAVGVHWHPNGQLAVVAGRRHVHLFHAAGRFVEALRRTAVPLAVARTALLAGGEDVAAAGRAAPVGLLRLATAQWTPLPFLHTRADGISSVAAHPRRADVAVAGGQTVRVGSVASGSVTHRIDAGDPVVEVAFGDAHAMHIATRRRLLVYDVRKTAQFVRAIADDGTLDVTAFAWREGTLAVGTISGVVSVYNGNEKKGPVRALKNLTTSISHMAFGERSSGEKVLAYTTRGQKGGFRLATLPECRVLPSFPAISQRHGFTHCLTIAPTVPILSIGERQKVTNYAL